LLPTHLRDPVAALYAFCRVSDDLVDDSDTPREAARELEARLDAIYQGRVADDPVDRALLWLAEDFALPRAPLDALLQGYLWDAEGRRHHTLSDVLAYAVRVAGSVGVAMSWLLERREPHVLARAADLGVAMQLTNIARDVGEDARRGRLYLPGDWLGASEPELETWLAAPRPTDVVRDATRRLLDHADVLYRRADAGIGALPPEVRTAIRVARHVYAEIGEVVRAEGYDSVSSRAVTTTRTKVRLTVRALGQEAGARMRGEPEALHAPALAEAAWLCMPPEVSTTLGALR